MVAVRIGFVLSVAALAYGDDFTEKIRPVLNENCAKCHNPANPRNRLNFLKAGAATDVETQRSLWRNVATQLRNRTMPPGAAKMAEADRMDVANWIEARLRSTGCTSSEYAG